MSFEKPLPQNNFDDMHIPPKPPLPQRPISVEVVLPQEIKDDMYLQPTTSTAESTKSYLHFAEDESSSIVLGENATNVLKVPDSGPVSIKQVEGYKGYSDDIERVLVQAESTSQNALIEAHRYRDEILDAIPEHKEEEAATEQRRIEIINQQREVLHAAVDRMFEHQIENVEAIHQTSDDIDDEIIASVGRAYDQAAKTFFELQAEIHTVSEDLTSHRKRFETAVKTAARLDTSAKKKVTERESLLAALGASSEQFTELRQRKQELADKLAGLKSEEATLRDTLFECGLAYGEYAFRELDVRSLEDNLWVRNGAASTKNDFAYFSEFQRDEKDSLAFVDEFKKQMSAQEDEGADQKSEDDQPEDATKSLFEKYEDTIKKFEDNARQQNRVEEKQAENENEITTCMDVIRDRQENITKLNNELNDIDARNAEQHRIADKETMILRELEARATLMALLSSRFEAARKGKAIEDMSEGVGAEIKNFSEMSRAHVRVVIERSMQAARASKSLEASGSISIPQLTSVVTGGVLELPTFSQLAIDVKPAEDTEVTVRHGIGQFVSNLILKVRGIAEQADQRQLTNIRED